MIGHDSAVMPTIDEVRDRFRYDRDRDGQGRPANARPRDRYGRPLPRGAVDQMATREEPADVVRSIEEAFERAVRLFDEQRFFEAHEFFEYVWQHDGVDRDTEFWKGVTQAAVGFCHTQRGNEAGAVTLLTRAAARLDGYPSPHRGVDGATLARAVRAVSARVIAVGPSPHLAFPRFPRG